MESVFQPGAPAGYAVDALDKGQSMMQRATAARQLQQMREQRIAESELMMPVKQAQANADLVSAGASIALATRMQHLRKQAATVANQANDEFLEANQLADWDAQSMALERIQAKYAWMGQLPEYKGFLEAVDKSRANAVTRALTNLRLDTTLESARIAAESRTQVAETNQAAATERTSMQQTASTERTKIATGAKDKGSSANRDAAMQRTEYKSLMGAAAQNEANAAKMSLAGNEANAAIYRKHAQEFRDKAQSLLVESEPVSFSVPNVTDKAAQPAPAPAEATPPEETPAVEETKLYVPPQSEGAMPEFSPAVKTPEQQIEAMQQAVDDGVITVDQARDYLTKLGFKRREG